MNFADPCCRLSFLRDVDLLPDWAKVYLWKPSDQMECMKSDVYPWQSAPNYDSLQAIKFSTNMVINGRTVAVLFWGVN
jgi:hypothetical protein